MIKFEEAIEIVLNKAYQLDTETIDFKKSINRILATDVKSDMNMPPFNKSAVDGYACKKNNTNTIFKVIEIIQAGSVPEKNIKENECSKIMTGAIVPIGADYVAMVEHVEKINEQTIKILELSPFPNICFEGEDIKKGDTVLNKGTLIKPQHISVLATVGCVKPEVFKQVKVGVISTGNEIVEPFRKPELSQIRNSNAYQLCAQIDNINAIAEYIGIASDTELATRAALKKAINGNDVILFSGGVSMGDFDLVPKILKEIGFEIHFHQIAIQPGKPTLFATKDNKICFGLPGNPVSTFNQFELLVKPMLLKMMGTKHHPIELKLKLANDFNRKRAERLNVLPIKLNENNNVEIIEFHGSAHINSLNNAIGFVFIPIGINNIKKGELVDVRLL